MSYINQMEPLYGDAERTAMQEYLDSGQWLTEFDRTRTFEDRIAERLGIDHAWATCNGTISLVIALRALDVGPGDEVVVPDYTQVATAFAVDLVGATPVFVDVDADTLELTPAAVTEAITPDTEAVLYVPLNGRGRDVHAVRSVCDEHDLYMVEDAAQALGSTSEGSPLGTVGHIGSFSFSYAKIITTGQGGMLVTDDDHLADRIRKLRNFGRPEGGVDYHEIVGLNAKFTDLQAVIGLEQLATLDERIERKQALFRIYRQSLGDIDGLRFPPTDLEETPPWNVDVVLTGTDRGTVIEELEERDIGTRPFYPAIHSLPPYADRSGTFPTASRLSANGLWLPSGLTLTDAEVERVCAAFRDVLS